MPMSWLRTQYIANVGRVVFVRRAIFPPQQNTLFFVVVINPIDLPRFACVRTTSLFLIQALCAACRI